MVPGRGFENRRRSRSSSRGWSLRTFRADGAACREGHGRLRRAGTCRRDSAFLDRSEATRVDSDAAARCGLRRLDPMVTRLGAAPTAHNYRRRTTAPGAFRRFLSRIVPDPVLWTQGCLMRPRVGCVVVGPRRA